MKKIFTGLCIAGFATIATAQTISFDNTTLDYGTIQKGSNGNREFIIKNTGDKPLIISKVVPACGCTTPDWSKEPIAPGKTGKIAVHYNTELVNPFKKIIEVFSNDPKNSRSVVYIQGEVVDRPVQSPSGNKRSISPKVPPRKK